MPQQDGTLWERLLPCDCGQALSLAQRRCPVCRRKNPVQKVYQRRKHWVRFLEGRVRTDYLERARKADFLFSSQENYDQILRDILVRPFPERTKKEDLRLYLRRVDRHFPELLKNTSPSRMAHRLDDLLERTAQALSRLSLEVAREIVPGPGPLPAPVLLAQAEQLKRELEHLVRDYIGALKTMKLYHDRVIGAYKPVRAVFKRALADEGSTSFWRKAKSRLQPIGQLLRFPAAIWDNPGERELLQKLDQELVRLLEQIGRFRRVMEEVGRQRSSRNKAHAVSLASFVLSSWLQGLGRVQAQERSQLVYAALARPGVGVWYKRWWYRRRRDALARHIPG